MMNMNPANQSNQLTLILNYLNREFILHPDTGMYYFWHPDRPLAMHVALGDDPPIAYWCLAIEPKSEAFSGQMAINSYRQLVWLSSLIREGVLPQNIPAEFL